MNSVDIYFAHGIGTYFSKVNSDTVTKLRHWYYNNEGPNVFMISYEGKQYLLNRDFICQMIIIPVKEHLEELK